MNHEDRMEKILNGIYDYAKFGTGDKQLVDYEGELNALMQEESKPIMNELIEAVDALIDMWNQYCGKEGHSFMNAGENASKVLMRYGILKDAWSDAEYDSAEKYLQLYRFRRE